MTSCAITGHRPSKLHLGSEYSSACIHLKQEIHRNLLVLYQKGVHRFYLGGALGVDLWAGEILAYMRETENCEKLEIILAIPFPGHELLWNQKSRERLARLQAVSNSIHVVCTETTSPRVCYRKRNQYLVDHADCLLAVYNAHFPRSGTGMTVRFGIEKGIPIYYIDPEDFSKH